MSESIEAVVFDWDGTLVDSKRALVASYHATTTEVLGHPFPTAAADIEEIVQMRGKESFDLIAGGNRELSERIATVFHRHYTEQQRSTLPFPGALETLASLRAAGLGIGVATSKARIRLDLEAERTGIGALVDESISGDEVEQAKPDPEPVTEVIRRLGTSPARTLYVGDGPNDVLAAHRAGAIAVAVSFGFHPAQALAAGPEHVIDRLGELLPIAGAEASSTY